MHRLLLLPLFIGMAIGQEVPTDVPDTTLPPTTPPPTTLPPTTLPPTTPPPTTLPPTTAPTTPAPAPPGNYYYNVTTEDKKTYCILMSGNVTFNIEYDVQDGKKNVDVSLPKPSADVKVQGDCSESDQYMSISWGPEAMAHKLVFKFKVSENGKNWNITELTAVIPIDDQFVNSTQGGKNLMINSTVKMMPHEVPVNRSFSCYNMDGGNYTAYLDTVKQQYTDPIKIEFDNLQIQAYNKIPGVAEFAAEMHCDADKTSDIVPIAVGCALGALVIIVLIAYVVARRRRSAAYQSV